MGKKNRPTPQSLASGPGAAPPDPEPAVQAPEPESETPETTTPVAEDSTSSEGDLEALENMRGLSSPEPSSAAPSIRCRVNWHFHGFQDGEHHGGDEVTTTEDEAAPFLGGVLTRLEDSE